MADHGKVSVFISYARDDQALAATIRHALEATAVEVLGLSEVAAGELWVDSISMMIRRADAYILIISPAFLKSAWLSRELGAILDEAESTRKRIIPLLAGGVRMEDIPPSLQRFQLLQISSDQSDLQTVLAPLKKVTRELESRSTPAPAKSDYTRMMSPPAKGEDRVLPVPPPAAPPSRSLDWLSWAARAIPAMLQRLLTLPIGLLHWLAKLKLVKPSPELPPDTKMDDVHFTVTAPATFATGEDAELIIWAHLRHQEKLVLRKAMAALGVYALHKLLFRSVGPVPLERGSVLSVSLEIDGLQVPNPHNRINWTGEIGNAFFVVSVPQDAAEGTRRAACYIKVNGLEVGRIDFVVKVAAAKGKNSDLEPEFTQHRSAFASYASEDRDMVLAAVSGMKKRSPKLEVFVDVMSLRSNDDWEERLMAEIEKADVFYLFWCNHALRSEWVDREWRRAYELRGASFIDPVPLQSPDDAPQPKELAKKHFYDPITAFMKHSQ